MALPDTKPTSQPLKSGILVNLYSCQLVEGFKDYMLLGIDTTACLVSALVF